MDRSLRVAVIGSGPAGFYTAQSLLQAGGDAVDLDMFDALSTPFGLVRHGVAPDHPKIKSVTAVYEKIAAKPNFRFFGNVRYGTDISLGDLSRHYHHVVFCTGAQTDRRLGISGEDLAGSHPATEFVAWYNGHPEFRDCRFDLSHERAVVVGVGNVAADVARILCRTTDELAATDITDYALDALAASRIREVHVLGRRGPAQAAFSNPEIKELGEIEGTETTTLPGEMELDSLTRATLEQANDKALARKLALLGEFAGRTRPDAARKLVLRFLVSPVELLDDGSGRVGGVRIVRNELRADAAGTVRPQPTEEFETLDAGLVLRSVGYRGVALPELPFDDRRGIIPNENGRIIDGAERSPLPGLYVAGWIKRGPTGVIGTNKPDGKQTAECVLEDAQRGVGLEPTNCAPEALPELLDRRGIAFVSYDDWKLLDALELARGKAHGRPRVKLTRREEFDAALGRSSA